MKISGILLTVSLLFVFVAAPGYSKSVSLQDSIYDPGILKPVDSILKVVVGQMAPDFTLRSIRGESVHLRQYRGNKKVVLSFVPAAFTPVCSDQWPGYNISKNIFDTYNAVLLGITVDNIPSLHAWVQQMGSLWFEVLSDFWPHGQVADTYGLLRSDGVTERALVFIDSAGIIRAVEVTDINVRPPFELLVKNLQKMD
ncbi:MAG: redoxin domain-containing protein [Desulfobulbaceae bacterium]|nr:redoxin domain-containing protein [Desulfobulbaceae bacterium]